MKIGIIGTGAVGQTLGTGLVALGHTVKIGSREPQSEKLQEWVKNTGAQASAGTYAEVAQYGEVIFLATLWTGTENALRLADPKNLAGKVVIDITNPLSFGPNGPGWAFGFSDSGGESIQRWLPQARVVKALNTVPAAVMIKPDYLGEPVDMFICGDDLEAKKITIELLNAFGWEAPIDLGGIVESRLLEALTMLWVKYMVISQDWQHAFKLVRKQK
jgi:8-hydroxy-5-deazaflavin:NADPH oxidoreductase